MDSLTQNSTSKLPKELREVSVERLTDPTAVRGAIEVLDQDVVNLDAKGFEVKRVVVPLVDSCLVYVSSSAAVRSRTLVHEDFDAFSITGPKACGSIDGAELQAHVLIIAGPGANAEIIVESGYESIILLMPPQVLHRHLDLRGTKGNFLTPKEPELWHPDAELGQDHFRLGKQIVEAAENSAEIFNDNHWARYGAQVEFMDSLFATIESCDPNETVASDKKGKTYSQIVRTCEDYTLNLEERRPYLSELCAAANVSERTLQYAFRDIMGMSPLTYLHRLRLHRARDELQKAKSDSTTVTDVAMNWGFWHFGEFSRAYKNCFGEVPSKTLKQSSGD